MYFSHLDNLTVLGCFSYIRHLSQIVSCFGGRMCLSQHCHNSMLPNGKKKNAVKYPHNVYEKYINFHIQVSL